MKHTLYVWLKDGENDRLVGRVLSECKRVGIRKENVEFEVGDWLEDGEVRMFCGGITWTGIRTDYLCLVSGDCE